MMVCVGVGGSGAGGGDDGECEVVGEVLSEEGVGVAGDHGGVVDAEVGVGEVAGEVVFVGEGLDARAEQGVGADAAAEDEGLVGGGVLLEGALEFGDEDVDGGGLETGGEVGDCVGVVVCVVVGERGGFAAADGVSADGVEERGFEAGEGEVQGVFAQE